MKHFLLLSLLALLLPMGAWADNLNVDDTFTADGITYKVTSTSPREVQVGNSTRAIDKTTTGALTIPASVIGTDGNSYSVKSIGNQAFNGCSGLTSVTMPNSVTSIGNQAFSNCSNLISVNIPNSVTAIESNAFAWSRALANIIIPGSVIDIGSQAFFWCEALPSVTIPNSVRYIGENAFGGCSGLKEVYSKIEVPFAISDNVFSKYNIPLYVPVGTKALYEATDGWKNFTNIVEMRPENTGDVNGDNTVDVADIASIIDYMSESADVPSASADVNGDGTVDVADIAAIIDIMAGKGETNCPDNHHPHMIDLGLPSGTKWACCNVGASTPEEYGDYFAWGETQPKDVYNWDTYQYGSSQDNVVNIGSDIAGTDYDAATANWGSPWRMPSMTQIEELIGNTTSTWTTQNGVNGLKFTGSNSSSVFLPAGGQRMGDELKFAGSGGWYWSSKSACGLRYFHLEGTYRSYGWDNYEGHTVRPVR